MYCISPFTKNDHNRQIYRDKICRLVVAQGWEGLREMGNAINLLMGMEFLFEGNEMFLIDGGDDAQFWEQSKSH